ncbi:MAG TPA: hypothetical protein VGL82_08220 [Bryobacteraceae bacterium]|jgi:hypothetical protein
MGKRVAYLLAGYGFGSLIGLALWSFTGKYHVWPVFLLGNSLGLLFTLWAEHAGKVKTIDELNRPLTLFPRD